MTPGSDLQLLDAPSLASATEGAHLPATVHGDARHRRRITRRKTVAALDLGTTKICALIGQVDPFGHVSLMGMGQVPSHGLKRGMVADIDKTVESIEAAVALAEEQARTRVSEVYVGIAGGHISCINSSAMIEVANPMRGVTQAEQSRVLERSKAVAMPDDREILHVIPQEFICDDQAGVKNPIGMSCSRLQANVHLVTAAVASAQNIVRCVHRAKLRTADLLLESLASSMAILTEDEKELGVLLLDIGGGTCDVALFQGGSVRFSGAVPHGGQAITGDIAHALKIGRLDAELLKRSSGAAYAARVPQHEQVEVPSLLTGTPVRENRQFLAEVIEARCAEILEAAREMVHRAGYANSYTAGVVLTGGTALLDGLEELASEIFEGEVRVGSPRNLAGSATCPATPIYATAQGLLLYGIARELRGGATGGLRAPFLGRVYQKFLRMVDLYV